jgi:hypothetical protein
LVSWCLCVARPVAHFPFAAFVCRYITNHICPEGKIERRSCVTLGPSKFSSPDHCGFAGTSGFRFVDFPHLPPICCSLHSNFKPPECFVFPCRLRGKICCRNILPCGYTFLCGAHCVFNTKFHREVFQLVPQEDPALPLGMPPEDGVSDPWASCTHVLCSSAPRGLLIRATLCEVVLK